MKADDIKEPNIYHWKRTLRGVTSTGKGPVVQKYHLPKAGGGWFIIIHDAKTKRPLTFRPVHIVRPVRAR